MSHDWDRPTTWPLSQSDLKELKQPWAVDILPNRSLEAIARVSRFSYDGQCNLVNDDELTWLALEDCTVKRIQIRDNRNRLLLSGKLDHKKHLRAKDTFVLSPGSVTITK